MLHSRQENTLRYAPTYVTQRRSTVWLPSGPSPPRSSGEKRAIACASTTGKLFEFPSEHATRALGAGVLLVGGVLACAGLMLRARHGQNFRAHRQFSLTLERTRLPIVNPRDAVLTLPYVARHDHSTYAA